MSKSSAFSTCSSLIVTSQVRNGAQFLKATQNLQVYFEYLQLLKCMHQINHIN